MKTLDALAPYIFWTLAIFILLIVLWYVFIARPVDKEIKKIDDDLKIWETWDSQLKNKN